MTWALVHNPEYAGMDPRPMRAACHDGSPFLTILCTCGAAMHLHESQILALPQQVEIESPCHGCGTPLVFPPGALAAGFAELRSLGWVDDS